MNCGLKKKTEKLLIAGFISLVLCASPLLNFAATNSLERSEYDFLVRLIVLAVVLISVLSILIASVSPVNFTGAVVSSSVLFSWLFVYRDLSDFIGAQSPGLSLSIWVVVLVVLMASAIKVMRMRGGPPAAAIFCLMIAAYPFGQTAVYYFKDVYKGYVEFSDLEVPGLPQDVMSARAPTDGFLPNVYVISHDSYVSADVLWDMYLFDNTQFVESLATLGFQFPKKSRSNYPFTTLSLRTLLNMTYTVPEPSELRKTWEDGDIWKWQQKVSPWKEIYDEPISGNTLVSEEMKRRGYQYIFAENGFFDSLKCSDANDICLNEQSTSYEFYSALFSLTPLSDLGDEDAVRLLGEFGELLVRGRADDIEASGRAVYSSFTVERLMDWDSKTYREPFFLFVHTVGLHNFAWDQECGFRPPQEIPGWVSIETIRIAYIDQLKCVNSMTLEAVRAIIENDPKAIIILQADHGTWSIGDLRNRDQNVLTDSRKVRELFEIMNAYRLPDPCKALVYDSISPVNTFRLVFSCLDGAKYKFVPDRHYLISGPSWKVHPFVAELYFE